MTGRILVDTGVLVEYLRGRPRAGGYLEALDAELQASVITVAELFAGALIAATASTTGATLATFNDRHFPMLDAVKVPYER